MRGLYLGSWLFLFVVSLTNIHSSNAQTTAGISPITGKPLQYLVSIGPTHTPKPPPPEYAHGTAHFLYTDYKEIPVGDTTIQGCETPGIPIFSVNRTKAGPPGTVVGSADYTYIELPDKEYDLIYVSEYIELVSPHGCETITSPN